MPDAALQHTIETADPNPVSLVLAAQRPALADIDGRPFHDPFLNAGTTNGFVLREAGAFLVGGLRVEAEKNLSAQAFEIYQRLFDACDGRQIARIWNVIPAVNAVMEGLENYRAFSMGRAEAFVERFGSEAERHMCAATGIGGFGRYLDVTFAATRAPLVHLENPEQLPAYRYPALHGPKSPSFARATLCMADGVTFGFVSGTAAVKGHESIVGGGLLEQCAATVDNLSIMERQLAGSGLAPDALRHVNVFIRRREDAPFIMDYLARRWLRKSDRVRVHLAEICRAELGLEIEFTAIG